MNTFENRGPSHRQAVTVVIPYFNQRTDLIRCLDSLRPELTSEDEIIVVDDASSDAPNIKAFLDLSIQVVTHPHNKGPATARNNGVALARNLLIAFMDADDICLPNRIASQRSFLVKHPGFFGCVGDYYFERRMNFAPSKVLHQQLPDDVRRQLLCGRIFAAGSTLMVHKSHFTMIGGYDDTLRVYEDWDLLLRALHQLEIGHCGELVAHISSSTRAANKDLRLSVLTKLSKRYMAEYKAQERRMFKQALAYEQASAYLRARSITRGVVALLDALRIAPAAFLTRFVGRILFGRT